MSDDRFNYHRHLRTIGESDAAFLERKDRSYGASWKESGRSAWFMCRRMIDRLNNMMARPRMPNAGFNVTNVNDTISAVDNGIQMSHAIDVSPDDTVVRFPGTKHATVEMLTYLRDCYLAEDILATCEADARALKYPTDEAPDGSVLAVVRDLRRYLTLVEAEVLERTMPRVVVTGQRSREVEVDRPRTVNAPEFVEIDVLEPCRATLTVPLEDSNRHAARTDAIASPWVVDSKWMFENGYNTSARMAIFNIWWYKIARDQWKLRGHVSMPPGSIPPAQLASLYKTVTNSNKPDAQFILDIGKVRAPLRPRWPKFPMEVNLKEKNELPEWADLLYKKVDGDDKWRLTDESWSRWG